MKVKKSRAYLRYHLLRINPSIEKKIEQEDGDSLDYFFKPMYLGRGQKPAPQKAIFEDGKLALANAKSPTEKRGRKSTKTVYGEWYRRRKEPYRRIYKAPIARSKTADKNRKIIFEIVEKLTKANPNKKYKKTNLVAEVLSACIGIHDYPRDRKTVTKFVDEFLFISSS